MISVCICAFEAVVCNGGEKTISNVQGPEQAAFSACLWCFQFLDFVILSSNRNKTRPILAAAKDFQTELSAFRRCLLMINENLS
jgi:hypothetical protein